jgi:hypothetical protein
MPRRYITDLRHGLDHDGQPAREPREAAELFRCLGNVAAAAHFADVGEIVPTVLRCFTPRGRGTCRGALDARLESDGTVDWICPVCGTEGNIQGFDGTPFDAFRGRDASKGKQARRITARLELADLQDLARTAPLNSLERRVAVRARRAADGAIVTLTDAESKALGVAGMRLASPPRSKAVRSQSARQFVAELFERPPTTEAEAAARIDALNTIASHELRQELVAFARAGGVSIEAEDLWAFAYRTVAIPLHSTGDREASSAELESLIHDRAAPLRARSMALTALQGIDDARAHGAMVALDRIDGATIVAEQMRPLVRAIEQEPSIAEIFVEAIGSEAGKGSIEMLNAIESIRRDEGVSASVLYGEILARSSNDEIARFTAARLAADEPGGRATAREAARRNARMRHVIEHALSARVEQRPATRTEAWISGSDGAGAVVVLFVTTQPNGSRSLIDIVFRLAGEVRDGFIESRARENRAGEIMTTMTGGGGPAFTAVPAGIAVRLALDAFVRSESSGRRPSADIEAVRQRIESLEPTDLPEFPNPSPTARPAAIRDLLRRPEFRSWFFSPGDLTETGVDDTMPSERVLAAIAGGPVRERLIAMTEYMARWFAWAGEVAASGLMSAITRDLRADFANASLPTLMLERSTLPVRGARSDSIPMRRERVGDPNLRGYLRQRFFARVRQPVGRDLARLDFMEAALSILESSLPTIPPSEQPRNDEQQVMAHEVALEFRLGAQPLDRARVVAILRKHGPMGQKSATALAAQLAEGLASFRTVVCGSCRVRCVDGPAMPVTRAFFDDRHPSFSGNSEAEP